jgi:hypothetical protein
MEASHASEEVFETPDVGEDIGGTGEWSSARGQGAGFGAPDGQHGEPESVVPTSLDPDGAFEVFHGKKFETLGYGEWSRRSWAGHAWRSRSQGTALPSPDAGDLLLHMITRMDCASRFN